ncbi:MAG: hypothetical protein HQL32_11365, partial [Planctomycetes bacterium]|nr:hypothetical protein [Planctomycetota bacterium]
MKAKKDFRAKVKKYLSGLNDKERSLKNALLTQKLMELELCAKAQHIHCFASFGDEWDTFPFMREMLAQGKQVYCPRVIGPGLMEHYPVSDEFEFDFSSMGIPEPRVTDAPADPKIFDLIIIPGV